MADNKLDIKAFLDKDEQKDLLRLLTAGSVDDGKSTLIGRLLFDSKKLYEDQLDALERDSKRVGNAGEHIDYALLLDGLKAEREQGITIDVAYRYFSTNGRKFIIADTPGHEQYTRNMITGGSTANLAIILVDARTGVITQTRRHTFLVSLLGIKHVVLAVNKMDLVGFSEDVLTRLWLTIRSLLLHWVFLTLTVFHFLHWMGIMWWISLNVLRGTRGFLCSISLKRFILIMTIILRISVSRFSMCFVRIWISEDSVVKLHPVSFAKGIR